MDKKLYLLNCISWFIKQVGYLPVDIWRRGTNEEFPGRASVNRPAHRQGIHKQMRGSNIIQAKS
jgi:hypothetical protein